MLSEIPVNYLALVVAVITSQIIGAVWYSPIAFGPAWMKGIGMDPKKSAEMMKKGQKAMLINFFVMLVTAYTLNHVIQFSLYTLGEAPLTTGLMTGFWMWLGFVAPILLGSVLWESKSLGFYAINAAHYLVTFLAMGAILGTWM